MHSKIFGGILLVAGTSIGGGMLALPISTAASGFFHSSGLFVACFFFMLATVFLLLEANLWSSKPGANIISLCKERLGRTGEVVAWVTFLLLLYSVAAAYISGGGSLVGSLMQQWWPDIPMTVGMIIFALVFGGIVFFGAGATDFVNRVLMTVLIAVFGILIVLMVPKVNITHFQGGEARYLWVAIPIMVLSFTANVVVPSLCTYMNRDVKRLTLIFMVGSIIPLVFYVLWQFVILGVLPPSGEDSIATIGAGAHPLAIMTTILQTKLGFAFLALAFGTFSFLALVTSFLAVSLSLSDFMADGLWIQKNIRGRAILTALTIVPPFLFALIYPQGFVLALGYAGVFVAILYGILPALMVWQGRYRARLTSAIRVPGGKITLIVVLLGSIAVVVLQVLSTLGLLPVYSV